MSTYQLDDGLVEEFLDTLHESEDEMPSGKLGNELRKQIPLPIPTKLGAVVHTESGAFVRADGSTTPWIAVRMPGVAFVERPDWLADDQIGRITEVLSEGVDL